MRKLMIACLALAACGGSVTADRVVYATAPTPADVRAGIGKVCALDADCAYALSCTDALDLNIRHCALRWVPFEMAECPAGYGEMVSSTMHVGQTVDLNHPPMTGFWCAPLCNDASDCPNRQSCGGGICYTP